ncbi:UDP-4-amino-4,6-dideoxy-N-acetyl-beta-L-altrosamine N-acetyltransferase [Psychrobacter sp. H8-1]|uniref:UDP-4-amino-4, 6-dideoxy-N-acetyl-beta-L-altrosamine N-acetyltransferase n=1 Tax=Psychrobacter sp. H8-1 TaxID=2774129 RepID=UPI00191B88FE|nr:UDP-4-amino-4,6-dideoxy-N-acetyl-beta-L-altrosamine N-acetyltransferase [Psychrobacter sp. H8-1]
MFKGKLRPVVDRDIDMIFEWRNREEIRINMYNHEKIPYENHRKWFASIATNKTNQYFIYEQEQKPLGLVSFNNIDRDNSFASWAFYSADLSTRGLGSEMERLALKYAFEDLKLNKLYCEVLDFNFPVVRFHQKHGFKLEGVKRQHYKRGDSFYDVYQLAILKKDYEEISKSDFKSNIDKSYEWVFEIDTKKIIEYSELSGDKNPMHLDDVAAKNLGFKSRVAHKEILLAEISRVAASKYPGPNTTYIGQDVDYLAPAYPNKKITGNATLITQVGRYCLIRYELFDQDKLIATSNSEFLLGK